MKQSDLRFFSLKNQVNKRDCSLFYKNITITLKKGFSHYTFAIVTITSPTVITSTFAPSSI
jgi:hypothetical protein